MRLSGFSLSFSAHALLRRLLMAALLLTASATHAQETENDIEDVGYRWFEVEVLVFRYTDVDPEDPEQFPLAIRPIPVLNSRDLFSERLTPPIASLYYALPVCEGKRSWAHPVRAVFLSGALFAAENQLSSSQRLGCRRLHDDVMVSAFYPTAHEFQPVMPSELPVVLRGGKRGTREEMLQARIPFLVPTEQFALTPLRQQLDRRQDTAPILHTAWRQPVFARTVGRRHRLIGGRNFSETFDYLGFPITTPAPDARAMLNASLNSHLQEDIHLESEPFDDLLRLLDAADRGELQITRSEPTRYEIPERPRIMPRGLPDQVWEFDGLIHIYLVGNHLHIQTDFNLREPVRLPANARDLHSQIQHALGDQDHTNEFLRAYPFQQLRRVISQQTHYFDHPHYGVVVQIRRTELSNRR